MATVGVKGLKRTRVDSVVTVEWLGQGQGQGWLLKWTLDVAFSQWASLPSFDDSRWERCRWAECCTVDRIMIWRRRHIKVAWSSVGYCFTDCPVSTHRSMIIHRQRTASGLGRRWHLFQAVEVRLQTSTNKQHSFQTVSINIASNSTSFKLALIGQLVVERGELERDQQSSRSNTCHMYVVPPVWAWILQGKCHVVHKRRPVKLSVLVSDGTHTIATATATPLLQLLQHYHSSLSK